jgi:2-oxo-4-hydroxy-4-carboxy-5-ureidoimidazoline decarboxylase
VKYSIAEVNEWGAHDFVRVFGPVFEHSPWVAERTWAKRPFASLETLHRALCGTVAEAPEAEQLALIRAHPDLVGRAALAGTLTPASVGEQASAGLDRLTPEEAARFQDLNHAYRTRFDFPFVICARLNKKEAILSGFAARLQNPRAQEIQTALSEIGKIAWLRLLDLDLRV